MADMMTFPETTDCTDCIKHGGDWECDRTHCRKGTKQQATKASDCISRQSAYEAVDLRIQELRTHHQFCKKHPNTSDVIDVLGVKKYIDKIQCVKPKRPTGTWINLDEDDDDFDTSLWECSNCGVILDSYITQLNGSYIYCPKCGADMRGEQNEND